MCMVNWLSDNSVVSIDDILADSDDGILAYDILADDKLMTFSRTTVLQTSEDVDVGCVGFVKDQLDCRWTPV